MAMHTLTRARADGATLALFQLAVNFKLLTETQNSVSAQPEKRAFFLRHVGKQMLKSFSMFSMTYNSRDARFFANVREQRLFSRRCFQFS